MRKTVGNLSIFASFPDKDGNSFPGKDKKIQPAKYYERLS